MSEDFLTRTLDSARGWVEQDIQVLGKMPEGCSVSSFVEQLRAPGAQPHYRDFPAECKRQVACLRDHMGEEAVRRFLHAVLMRCIEQLPSQPKFGSLPARVRQQQLTQVARLVETQPADMPALDLGNDYFCKELGIASLRLYMAGAQLIDANSGIGRSMLWAQGLGDMPRRAFLLARLGGFRPYFEIHTHNATLNTFNEAGWEECYHCCSELYALHPQALGMMGGSWFYDPALDDISPRLAYLRSTPLSGGAHLLYISTGGGTVQDATATSPSRRKLYEEGRYQPKSYMLVWSRAAQQTWASARLDKV